jgi:enamine deaminase RidA (YjgF/YER057c/UK114 family)
MCWQGAESYCGSRRAILKSKLQLNNNASALANGKNCKNSPPARSTVEVARLPKDVSVEIDVIALA